MKFQVFFWLFCLMSPLTLKAAEPANDIPIKRSILAIYDADDEQGVRYSRIHQIAEMPLNHLGLIVRFHNIKDPLPPIDQLKDVRGVLTWFKSDRMADPHGYIQWANSVIDSGIKFVILGDLALALNNQEKPTPLSEINDFLERIGIRTELDWLNLTYDVQLIKQDARITGFERPFQGVLPSFDRIKLSSADAVSHLTARRAGDAETDSNLVVVSPTGGYAASGYIYHHDERTGQAFWYLNLFEFFRQTFTTDDIPKPDTTTISGNRIYYSHVDGDGWRNISEIKKYNKRKLMASEVLLKEVFESYSDLPVTVGPIVADLDTDWEGTEESQRIARDIFKLPNVEASSHTYSHPFYWAFFEDYSEERERSLVSKGPSGTKAKQRYGYDAPRAFSNKPFDVQQEVRGSIDFIERLLPPGKHVSLYQWSGDTSPGDIMLSEVTKSGLPNINGGDSRFDREFPSLSSVSPIGLKLSSGLQIYASNSNENTYTDLWRGRYFGFLHLIRTIKNTETPKRIKPFNIYYHMYSGEKPSSLNALLRNLNYARRQQLIPVTASHFARVAEGFFATQIYLIGERQWRVENRGRLQTIRFDNATLTAVDFSRSKGVIGQRHYQGSLYIALDPDEQAAIIALKDYLHPEKAPPDNQTYLISSTWRVRNLEHRSDGVTFSAQGFGKGAMSWHLPFSGKFSIIVRSGTAQSEFNSEINKEGLLKFIIDVPAIEPLRIEIRRLKKS